jgi:DNA-binding IclR family transcriptional regulator
MAGNIGVAGDSVSRRLLSVLDCFDVSRPVLSLTEIAAASGLPLSTARRLIVELVAWGGLERSPNGRYRIGMRLWRIGSFAPQQRDLREAALPYLHDLYEVALENVQLVVVDGLEALCVEKVSGPRAVATNTEVGGRLPLHATGVSKVLLAYSPTQLLTDTVAAGLTRYTPNTIVQPGRLAAVRQAVRENGLAFAYEEFTVGVVSVAAPVLTRDRRLLGALGIVARHTTRLDQLAPAVRTAALGVSRSCQ